MTESGKTRDYCLTECMVCGTDDDDAQVYRTGDGVVVAVLCVPHTQTLHWWVLGRMNHGDTARTIQEQLQAAGRR